MQRGQSQVTGRVRLLSEGEAELFAPFMSAWHVVDFGLGDLFWFLTRASCLPLIHLRSDHLIHSQNRNHKRKLIFQGNAQHSAQFNACTNVCV